MTKIFNKKTKPAFTLAEVLITLTIIGVIAAIVIPNLMQRNLEHEMVTKLKKNFSVLNNAYLQAIQENGSPEEWDLDTAYSQESSEKLYNYIKPYLKIKEECGARSTRCFASSYKALFSGNSSQSGINGRPGYYKFKLEDGTAIVFYGYGNECVASKASLNTSRVCGVILIDLNNKRGPNRAGVDLFMLGFTEKNVVPWGLTRPGLKGSTGSSTCEYPEAETPSQNGLTCGVHALYKGNMDYLRRDISNDWP